MTADGLAPSLVISDVDGTLVDPDKKLTTATIAAVGRLRAAGIPFTIISARPPSGIAHLATKLGLDTPLAAFNGGTILRPDGSVVTRFGIDADVVRGVFALADGGGATPWMFADGRWFARDPDNPHVAHERISSAQEPIIRDDMRELYDVADKLTFVSDDPTLLADLAQRAIAAFGERATIGMSQTYYLDVTAIAANKGDGVAALAAAARADLATTVVIGDMFNDLPMFDRAGISIAMGQAPEEVRRKADFTTASNRENGVARAIDSIILPMKAGCSA